MVRTNLAAVILFASLWSGYACAEGGPGAEPMWAQLSSDQRMVLAPLAGELDTLRPWQREKMLDIARDYPKMNDKQQQRVQKRLSHWSRMTPFERENARKKYQQFKSMTPQQKADLHKKWLEYQSLPEAEREKLRHDNPELEGADDLGN